MAPNTVQNCLDAFTRFAERIRQNQRAILIGGVGLQLVVLIAIMVPPMLTLATGDTILLKVIPVDPRDLFRGDYVILSYSFTRAPEVSSFDPDAVVYTKLVRDPQGKHWISAGTVADKPTSGKFLRGKVVNGFRVEYGIESFFVQEGEGLKYEQAIRQNTLYAEVAVDSEGQAVLKRLVIQ